MSLSNPLSVRAYLACLALSLFSLDSPLPATIEGLRQRFEVTFSYHEGFDAVGTDAFATASEKFNVRFSSLSECIFLFVPNSPDGRMTEAFPEGNIAFCAPSGQDVIGRIDFLTPVSNFSSRIHYFAGGDVTFKAFSESGEVLFSMVDKEFHALTKEEVQGRPVAYVEFSGNHENAAINIDDLVFETVGVKSSTIQDGDAPLIIEAQNYEAIR